MMLNGIFHRNMKADSVKMRFGLEGDRIKYAVTNN